MNPQVIGVLLYVGVWIMLCLGGLALVTTAVHKLMSAHVGLWRGRWVLKPTADPHVCNQPNRPRRRASRWRCHCGRLFQARYIECYGGGVWTWDKVDEDRRG